MVSPDRLNRPNDFTGTDSSPGGCPFCPGAESQTPPEIAADRGETAPDGPGWSLRVVPNKFPALACTAGPSVSDPLFPVEAGEGLHEVVIEHPDHDWNWADADPRHLERLMRVFASRSADHARDPRVRYTQIFRNEGAESGASLAHPHTQILSLPFVPVRVERQCERFRAYHAAHGTCVLCETIAAERSDGRRWIANNEHAAAFAPFASRFAYEVWIVPLAHDAAFEDAEAEATAAVARLIGDVVWRLRHTLGPCAFNLVLHTRPRVEGDTGAFHWHWELSTRFAKVAGFERATDAHINAVPPEVAAASLRRAAPREDGWEK